MRDKNYCRQPQILLLVPGSLDDIPPVTQLSNTIPSVHQPIYKHCTYIFRQIHSTFWNLFPIFEQWNKQKED